MPRGRRAPEIEGMKWCNKGQHYLPATPEYFRVGNGYADGLSYTCRKCLGQKAYTAKKSSGNYPTTRRYGYMPEEPHQDWQPTEPVNPTLSQIAGAELCAEDAIDQLYRLLPHQAGLIDDIVRYIAYLEAAWEYKP